MAEEEGRAHAKIEASACPPVQLCDFQSSQRALGAIVLSLTSLTCVRVNHSRAKRKELKSLVAEEEGRAHAKIEASACPPVCVSAAVEPNSRNSKFSPGSGGGEEGLGWKDAEVANRGTLPQKWPPPPGMWRRRRAARTPRSKQMRSLSSVYYSPRSFLSLYNSRA